MDQASKSFEMSLQRLEEIVKRMEQGNVPLEESMALFEEGTALVRRCGTLLDQAEQKVVRLMKGSDGAPVEMEFQDGE